MKQPNIQVRLVIGFFLIILGVLPKAIPLVITNLIFGFVLLLFYRIPFHFFLKRMLFIIPFFAISAILLVVVDGQDGFHRALLYTGRLFFVGQVLAFVMYHVSHEKLLKALHCLKTPTIFIELAFFTLRFVDVFKNEINQMMLSLRSKGFHSGKFFNLKTYRILGNLLGSMLNRALHRSERIYQGMLSRGYTGEMKIPFKQPIPSSEWILTSIWFMIMLVIQLSYWRWFHEHF